MAFVMRNSKFRHVFGKAWKREQCYDNIRFTRHSWENTYCDANPKFVAVVTESAGGGSFLVLPLSKVGRIDRDEPLVAGHKDAVTDVAFCPHNDNLIASCSDDCTVKIWEIPDAGLTKNLTEPVVDLCMHQKRVGQVVWHPSADHVILSLGCDLMLYVWNIETGEILSEVTFPDVPLCASFNYNGSKIAVTCKDKNLRVLDARSGDILQVVKAHSGAKPARCVYLKNGIVFTTGFSKMSEREYAIWDENDLSKEIQLDSIDKSNGVLFPFYDPDTSMIYLCGKGDTIIRYYEVAEENGVPKVFYLNLMQAKEPQKGIGFMTKRGLNVNSCEIARFYKLLNSGLCEVIPFTVPRKSDLFQEDLYPDTASDEAAMTAEEWMSGKNADPVLISLKDGYIPTKREAKVVKKSTVFEKKTPAARLSTASSTPGTTSENNEAAAATPALPPKPSLGNDQSKILEELKSLKDLVNKQEKRIEHLETRLALLETHTDEEEVEEESLDQC